VVLYDDGNTAHKSRWMKTMMKMVLEDNKAHSVACLRGGFTAFSKDYGFAVQAQPGPPVRTFPNEMIRGKLYLGGQHHSTQQEVIEGLQVCGHERSRCGVDVIHAVSQYLSDVAST
jgi:hypothetical protein